MLQSAGFLFFAFAGYARIATLGEEVRDPQRTIPRAIPLALGGVLVIYAAVAVTVLAVLVPDVIAATGAPLRILVEAAGRPGWGSLVGVGAGIAALGVLLNLIPGVSRTLLAMGRRGEVPRALAHVDGKRQLPLRAELLVAAAAIVLVVVLNLRSAIGVSGVAVLTYYALANASALTLTNEERRWTPLLAAIGLVGCLALIAALPWRVVLSGIATLAIGVVVRLLTVSRS